MFLARSDALSFGDFTLIKNSHAEIQEEVLGNDLHRAGAGSEQLLESAVEKEQPRFLCGKNKPLVTSESFWWPWPSSGVCQEELRLLRAGCHGQENVVLGQGGEILPFGCEVRPGGEHTGSAGTGGERSQDLLAADPAEGVGWTPCLLHHLLSVPSTPRATFSHFPGKVSHLPTAEDT